MDLREKGLQDMDWIHVTQHKDHLWALVNRIIHLRLKKILEISRVSEQLLAPERLIFMELASYS
jgi:hypothetical protein